MPILTKLARVILKTRALIHQRTIMTTPINVQKALENLETNPYFSKYSAKIAKLQETSPDEFLARVQAKEEQAKQTKDVVKDRQFSSLLKPKEPLSQTKPTDAKKMLKDIMKVELLQDKNAQEITEIWTKYHIDKGAIAAVIPKETYMKMDEKFHELPTALFPLPRSQGYEFIMCQLSGTSAHFTPLLCFQVHKENAPECLNIVHYTELMDEKNVVLMCGEYDKNVLDAKEAQYLANQLQLYYGKNDENKLNILRTLNFEPDKFKHMDLVKEIENIKLE